MHRVRVVDGGRVKGGVRGGAACSWLRCYWQRVGAQLYPYNPACDRQPCQCACVGPDARMPLGLTTAAARRAVRAGLPARAVLLCCFNTPSTYSRHPPQQGASSTSRPRSVNTSE